MTFITWYQVKLKYFLKLKKLQPNSNLSFLYSMTVTKVWISMGNYNESTISLASSISFRMSSSIWFMIMAQIFKIKFMLVYCLLKHENPFATEWYNHDLHDKWKGLMLAKQKSLRCSRAIWYTGMYGVKKRARVLQSSRLKFKFQLC